MEAISVESAYALARDDRVVINEDGTAVMPDVPGGEDGDWWVEPTESGDGFVVVNRGGDQGYITDEGDRYNRRPKWFATLDDGIAAVIGLPVFTALDGYSLLQLSGTACMFCRHDLVYTPGVEIGSAPEWGSLWACAPGYGCQDGAAS